MKVRTVSVRISAPADQVFHFLADVENLPRWATEFCDRVELEADGWVAHTQQGPLCFRIVADPGTGVIDMWSGPAPDQMSVYPVRVLGMADGTALVSFTFLQSADVSDALYERQYHALLVEMQGLARLFGGGELHAPLVPAALPTGGG